MIREYIVVVDGKAISVVASTPQYAISKARRGKGIELHPEKPIAFAASRGSEDRWLPKQLPGQLQFA